MNWKFIETHWDAFALQIAARWGRLDEDDIDAARGGRDDLLARVVARYGIDAEIAARHVDDWIATAALIPGTISLQAQSGDEGRRVSAS